MSDLATAPQAGLVISADGQGAWAWEFVDDTSSPYWLGACIASGKNWTGRQPIASGLPEQFDRWQKRFSLIDLSLLEDGQDQVGDFSVRQFHSEGVALAKKLKLEVGGRFRVFYEVPASDPNFRPITMYEVTIEGDVVRYVHRPHAGYVIDCDYAGAWAWVFRPDRQAFIGSNCAAGKDWGGQKDISPAMVVAFDAWQDRFERADLSDMRPGQDCSGDFSWRTFHRDGIRLAARLKQELGAGLVVIYSKPFEDKSGVLPRNFEILIDGSAVEYVHRPLNQAEAFT
jgi:hypothetical protein